MVCYMGIKRSGERQIVTYNTISLNKKEVVLTFLWRTQLSFVLKLCFGNYVSLTWTVSLCIDDIQLTCFQSKTTLCTPNPVFNHSTHHTFTMDNHSPLQGVLLQGFNSSSSPGEVIFELWKRHYYPNVRDQMIAKVSFGSMLTCSYRNSRGGSRKFS